MQKKTFQGTPYTEMPEELKKQKECPICSFKFFPNSGSHKYCSDNCKTKGRHQLGKTTTSAQYKNISGNWDRYFNRLLQKAFRRGQLTKGLLKEQLTLQKGLCALSGIELTCWLESGRRFKTNASIDRIRPGEPYSIDNIQLICSALNSWRGDTELKEFVWFCKQVTEYQEKLIAVHEKS